MYPSVIFYTKLYARGFVITHAGLLTKATVAGMLRRTLATLLPLLVTLASLASLALYPTGILTHPWQRCKMNSCDWRAGGCQGLAPFLVREHLEGQEGHINSETS